ncbi:MAG: sulfite exporter TauE/SafE family protein [Treponema sp.]|nr:sulfite exporter TauE/SafE family protein [Treponema sp.]
MIIEAILLGLTSGTYCCMYCGPVLIPFLTGREKNSYGRNALLTGTFLLSRLAMYFILGAVFAGFGLLVNSFFDPVFARKLSYRAYFLCGLFLLFNSLGVSFPWREKEHNGCKCTYLKHIGNDFITAVLTGLSVGLHICPPLWAAMTRSFFEYKSLTGLFYFVFFYIGTLPYFIPLLGIPFITKKCTALKKIARITQFIISIYFMFFMGLIPIVFN